MCAGSPILAMITLLLAGKYLKFMSYGEIMLRVCKCARKLVSLYFCVIVSVYVHMCVHCNTDVLEVRFRPVDLLFSFSVSCEIQGRNLAAMIYIFGPFPPFLMLILSLFHFLFHFESAITIKTQRKDISCSYVIFYDENVLKN